MEKRALLQLNTHKRLQIAKAAFGDLTMSDTIDRLLDSVPEDILRRALQLKVDSREKIGGGNQNS